MTSDDIKKNRRDNFNRMIAQTGRAKDVAAQMEIGPEYVSQIATGSKPMGDRFARKVEKLFGLQYMEMDEPHQVGGSADMAAYREAIETVLALSEEEIQSLIPLLRSLRKK